MDTPRLRVLSLASLLLAGCGPSATTSSGSPRTAVVTNSWAFEGVYIDKNYGDRPIDTLQAGRYTGALPANPGGDINGAGRYSARELGNGKWELKLNYDTGGASTVTVREIAGGIAIRDLAYGGETRLVRK